MSNLAKLFIFICGVVFVGMIINLMIRRKISERNSILWLFGSIIILILSAIPKTLDIMARIIGIEYPPALLFLLSTLILLYISLNQAIQISAPSEQIKELAQRVTVERFIEKENIKELEKEVKKCLINAEQKVE